MVYEEALAWVSAREADDADDVARALVALIADRVRYGILIGAKSEQAAFLIMAEDLAKEWHGGPVSTSRVLALVRARCGQ